MVLAKLIVTFHFILFYFILFYFILFAFLKVYLFIEREHAPAQVGEGQREGETESHTGSTPSLQNLMWGSNSRTLRS